MAPRVLVTGGAGFLGRRLAHVLLDAGFRVRVFDRLAHVPDEWPSADLEYIEGDVRARAEVAAAVRDCEAVCHVAGTPQLWSRRTGRYDAINYRGTIHVLEEAVTAGCQRILHVSSATVWPCGGWSKDGHDPRRLREAAGPYSRSKLRAERFALKLAREGAPILIVSPTVPIGPGDVHLTPPTRMLLDFCSQPRREYLPAELNVIDIRDLAQAMFRVLLHGQPGRPYLLGNQTVTLPDLIEGLGWPRPTRAVPYAMAIAVAYVSEWWARVYTGRPPLATVEGVRLTRHVPPPNAGADLARLGIVPRPLDHTLADVAAWFREVGWLPATVPHSVQG